MFKIAAFYAFKDMNSLGELPDLADRLRVLMRECDVTGTILLAEEGFNSAVCGENSQLDTFVSDLAEMLECPIDPKFSFSEHRPLRKFEVRIKPEIVTLRKKVDISLGTGTHVKPQDWNEIIGREDVLVLDARNDYEFKNGSFKGAVNPETESFSKLPEYVAENLDPKRHKSVAMFCTGGIRCEKFAPYMKSLGFENVFQLEGGILRYLEEVPDAESLWEGECFVFDDRRTVASDLKKGVGEDFSQRHKGKK